MKNILTITTLLFGLAALPATALAQEEFAEEETMEPIEELEDMDIDEGDLLSTESMSENGLEKSAFGRETAAAARHSRGEFGAARSEEARENAGVGRSEQARENAGAGRSEQARDNAGGDRPDQSDNNPSQDRPGAANR